MPSTPPHFKQFIVFAVVGALPLPAHSPFKRKDDGDSDSRLNNGVLRRLAVSRSMTKTSSRMRQRNGAPFFENFRRMWHRRVVPPTLVILRWRNLLRWNFCWLGRLRLSRWVYQCPSWAHWQWQLFLNRVRKFRCISTQTARIGLLYSWVTERCVRRWILPPAK